jgi:hypothetical protein
VLVATRDLAHASCFFALGLPFGRGCLTALAAVAGSLAASVGLSVGVGVGVVPVYTGARLTADRRSISGEGGGEETTREDAKEGCEDCYELLRGVGHPQRFGRR